MLDLFHLVAEPGLSYLEFHAQMDGWDNDVIYRDGKPVLVIKRKGPEFHFKSFGGYSFKRADILEVMQPLWDQFGYAETKTPKSDVRQQRFNERFGFRRTGEDEQMVHYKINKGESKCH